jgi:hypothetical protein
MLIIATSRIGTSLPLLRRSDMPPVRIELKNVKDSDDRVLNVKWDREDD